MRKISYSALLIATIIFFGCSGTYQGKKRANPISYTARVTTSTAFDIKKEVIPVLIDIYQYQLFRFEDTSDQIYFETQWRYRTPFEDEYSFGVIEARSRIIINARPRARYQPAGLYVVNISGENQVRFQDEDSWENMRMTDMLKSYFNNINDDLKMKLRPGIRRY